LNGLGKAEGGEKSHPAEYGRTASLGEGLRD